MLPHIRPRAEFLESSRLGAFLVVAGLQYDRTMNTTPLAIEPPRLGTVVYWAIEQIVTRSSSDRSFYRSWEHLLDEKRDDPHYPDVLESIRQNGFIRPLNADIAHEELRLSDGHHRLAAAIELGMEAVPVYIAEWPIISDDSGDWREGKPVDTDPATCGEAEGSGWW